MKFIFYTEDKSYRSPPYNTREKRDEAISAYIAKQEALELALKERREAEKILLNTI